jgi:outer membrane protein TolC
MTFQNMGFNSWTQYKGFRAQIEKLHFQMEAEKNAVERQLSEAWVKTKARQAQITLAQKKLAVSEATLNDALEQLRQGQGRNLDVITAENNLNQARQDLNTTIFEYNEAQVNLVHGLGLASVDSLTAGIPVRYIGDAGE